MRVYHEYTGTPLYYIWLNIKSRCRPGNKYYGGRGIKRCEEWDNFLVFREWSLENGYKDKLSIDRIDNDGHYEPSNCRWVELSQQAGNRRTQKNVSRYGVGINLLPSGKYTASGRIEGERYYVGAFDSINKAVTARREYLESRKA